VRLYLPTREKYPHGKRALFVYISEDLYVKIHELALSQHEKFHGALSAVVEEALRSYLTQRALLGGESPPKHTHTHMHTKTRKSVYEYFEEIITHIKREHGYHIGEELCAVNESELTRAIQLLIGIDPRTVEKYITAFTTHKLLEHYAGKSPNRVFRVIADPRCRESEKSTGSEKKS